MIKQKITLKKHLKHLLPYLVFSVGMLIIILYDLTYSIGVDKLIYIVYLVFGLYSFIHIYLYFEYYLTNRGVVLFIDSENSVIKYTRKHESEILISPETIRRIEIHQTHNYSNKGDFLTTDNFRYYKFFLKNDKQVIITSLLCPDLEYDISGKSEIIKSVIASILFYKSSID